jgi:hypothetical protein
MGSSSVRKQPQTGAKSHTGEAVRLEGGAWGVRSVAGVLDGAVGGDGRDREACVFEPRQVAPLVLEAALVEDVEDGVGVVRAPHQAVQRGALEGGQVPAGEEGDEVGGRVDRGAVDAVHGRRLPTSVSYTRRERGSRGGQTGALTCVRTRS